MSQSPDYSDRSVLPTSIVGKQPAHGVVAVLLREDRFLVIQRGPSVRAAGWWCFPGGGIEAGETPEMALVREIREELGVTVQPLRPLWRATTAWGVDLIWWLAGWPEPAEQAMRFDPHEVAQAARLTRAEILNLQPLLGSNLAFFERGIDVLARDPAASRRGEEK